MEKIRVGMNKADISTEEIPVIGTDALGPCVGVLIHSKKHKKSVVIHASTEWKEPVVQALVLLAENNIISYDNLRKSIETLYLYDKYNLYDFDIKTKQEILTKCPDISETTVQRALNDLLKNGKIIKISGGRYTSYTWNREDE